MGPVRPGDLIIMFVKQQAREKIQRKCRKASSFAKLWRMTETEWTNTVIIELPGPWAMIISAHLHFQRDERSILVQHTVSANMNRVVWYYWSSWKSTNKSKRVTCFSASPSRISSHPWLPRNLRFFTHTCMSQCILYSITQSRYGKYNILISFTRAYIFAFRTIYLVFNLLYQQIRRELACILDLN